MAINLDTLNKECIKLNSTFGFLLDKVPKDLLKELDTKIEKLVEDKSLSPQYNTRLVGQINEEYGLDISERFQQYLFYLFNYFIIESDHAEHITGMCKNPPKFNLSDTWINFQSKYEYNPPHFHYGLYSWVLWYKIPYLIENEIRTGPGYKKSSHQKNYNGTFNFQFGEGDVICDYTLPVDKEWEGIICLFPATLTHSVFPFYTSDEYRITIAGNIKFQ